MVRESRAEGSTSYDLPGAALVTAGLVALVYGFTEAAKPGMGWRSGTTLGLLIAAVALLIGFVVVERRARTLCCRYELPWIATGVAAFWPLFSSAPGCLRCSCS